MKAQSVLYNYTILQNCENERTSIQFDFLKLNSPFTTYFGKSSDMNSPPPSPHLKQKKTQILLQ